MAPGAPVVVETVGEEESIAKPVEEEESIVTPGRVTVA